VRRRGLALLLALLAILALEVREPRPAGRADRLRAAAAAALARAEGQWSSGRFEEAAVGYREALPPLAALGEARSLAEAEWHLGQALAKSGALRESVGVLERARARFHGLADPVSEARALIDLGTAERRLGETSQALMSYRSALALYRAAGKLFATATALHDIGRVLETRGDFEGAIQSYEEALGLWRQLGARSAEAATLGNLGSLYSLLGLDPEALDLLTRALALLGEERDPGKRASALTALGWTEYLAGQPERALGRYQEAMVIVEGSGDRQAMVGLWDRLGSILRALRRYQEAAIFYRRALDGSRAIGSRRDEGNTLVNLGWLDLEMGETGRARERLLRAVELLTASGEVNSETSARLGLSRAERLSGDFGRAREQAEIAVREIETMRETLRGAASRGQFLATRFDAYEEMAALLLDLDRREPGKGHAAEAMGWAERARARNLLEEMGGGGGESGGGGGRRQALRAEIAALTERRRALADEDPGDPHLPELDAALRARWLELERLVPAKPGPAPAPLSAAGIQALADEGSLLVMYLLAEPASFAWTVDREGVAAHLLPGRERIERLARQAAAGLSQDPKTAAGETVRAALSELSEAVLAPLGPRLTSRRVLAILADGALHRVPFAALPIPAGAPSAGEPLLREHEIAMLPSATVLAWQRRHLAGRPPAPVALAVLADPVFSRDDPRISGTTQVPAAKGRSADSGTFERLPYTTQEAQAIAGLVPRQSALVALGPAASRELVVGGALRRYRILHFATHGLLDPVLPERSGIVLSQFDEQGRPRAGFLSAPSLAELDLPAELAVLSGCRTGLGREIRGEGLVGLPQAFFRAGTRRVLVSLWNVRDQATAELMIRFYRQLLGERLSPAAALRSAQLSLGREERWRSPYFWAGFCLQGDWR
jgi:CHAT domain-containing protein/tetratricopeptide (TPR) repeat protein